MMHRWIALLLLLACGAASSAAHAAELRVSTNFEGGSARVESIDQAERLVRFSPAGDPAFGWPCWWYLQVEGLPKGERLRLEVAASNSPVAIGLRAGKRLEPNWAMPERAAYSTDGHTWKQTEPGSLVGERMRYEVIGDGGPVWIAWGPPFTPRDTDALIARAEKSSRYAHAFDLARTRGGRIVRGLRVSEAVSPSAAGIWINARQHAWESGSSWVVRGFVEWLLSADADARWLRRHAEVFIVPIIDVDNVATGNGGKEAAPHDHNRDWTDQPLYPEIIAEQQRLRQLAEQGRLDVFLALHNPDPETRVQAYALSTPAEFLSEAAQKNHALFSARAQSRIAQPLAFSSLRPTGPSYDPLWKQMSNYWIDTHGNPHTLALCFETPWNTIHGTADGYRAMGKQLGQTVADYLRQRMGPALKEKTASMHTP